MQISYFPIWITINNICI